jgi:isoquinoline 1-oxidoreductase beta subunit
MASAGTTLSQCKLTGAFDADNNLVALHYRLSGSQSCSRCGRLAAERHGPRRVRGRRPVRRSCDRLFGAELLVEHSMRNPHVPPGFWRGVNVNRQRNLWNASWMSWRMR